MVATDSGRNSMQNALSFVSVALMATQFVSKFMFWDPVQKKVKKYAQAIQGHAFSSLVLSRHAKTHVFSSLRLSEHAKTHVRGI